MRLPANSVGITDIISYRDCPERFAFGMRRHTEGGDPPEAVHPDTYYGKACHEGINWIEEDLLTNAEAVDRCFAAYPKLEPEDADRLRADFEVYRERDDRGVITIANETEIKIPLFEHRYPCDSCNGSGDGGDGYHCPDCPDGPGSGLGPEETIYFRGKIDRLYALAANPGIFIHRDYKSSKWRKTEEEVHSDKQMWAYNAGIYLFWPECDDLLQWYDQLRYGAIPTRKTAEQREEIWEWIKTQVRAILNDWTLEPTHNEWCPWCPIMEQCSEVRRLSEWAIARIEELAPNSDKMEPELVAGKGFEEYVGDLDLIARSRKMADRFEKSINAELKRLPDTRLEELGYKKSERSSNVWEPEALRAIHELVGDETFYMLIGLTKTSAERLLEGDVKKSVLDMGRKVGGATTVTKKKT